MRVCPNCGYQDPWCWRDAHSRGMEVDYTRIDELEQYQRDIAENLKAAPPNKRGVREYQNEYYAYGLWPSGYVRRRYIEIWRHHGWRAIPMEKHEPHDPLQKKLLEDE